MINIGTFGTKSNTGGITRITTGGNNAGSLFNPVYLWGQYFDDSSDVNGDMDIKGDVNVEGDISAYNVKADKIDVLKLGAEELEVKNFKADAANITDLETTNFKADKAELLNALIKELSATNLVTENLTVTKGAHFFELIIDKIKAAGGSVLFTPADGFKIDKVEPNAADNEITLYFRATDGDKKKANMWQKNDQARCQNFNKAELGVNYDVDSKYFWALVKNTNNELNNGDPIEVNLGTEEVPDMQKCHYIIISTKAGEFDGLVNPEVNDDIVMLGHRGEDVDRQAAIYIAAYSSIDEDLKAPLFVQYAGINDFNLYSHKFTWFSAGLTGQGEVRGLKANTISGDVRIGGQSIQDYIDGKTGNIKTYRLMPYVNNILIDKNGNISPNSVTVKIIYNNNGEISTLDNVPDMMRADVYGVTPDGTVTNSPTESFSAGNPISINTSAARQYGYMFIILHESTDENKIYDRCNISVIEDTSGEALHGGHWEFAYNLNNSKDAPTKPSDGTSIDNLSGGWTKTMPTPTDSKPYVWMSQCFVSGTGSYGSWSSPLRINGEKGQPGEDGKDIEFVYCTTTTDTQISAPANNSTPDWPRTSTSDHATSNGNVWYDNPQGVDSTQKYEWVSMRVIKGETFSNYSTPAIWSVYGSKGMDGDGYEYIFKLLTSSSFTGTEPKSITTAASGSVGKNKTEDDFIPNGWTDEPQEVSDQQKFCFVSTRKKHNGTWGDFTKPVLWSRYASRGSDGGWYALIFKNNTTNPGAPASSVTLDNLPSGWTKTPSTPDKGQFTWMSQRYVVDGTYKDSWTTPIRISGDDGEAGKDGNNINFIYKRTKKVSDTHTAPSYSSNATSDYQTNDDYTGSSTSGWTKSPTGVDSEYQYEWVATRTKPSGGKWGEYTVALWSKWGETGMDGDGVEFIYKLVNSASASYGTHPKNITTSAYNDSTHGKNKNENDFVPEGWTDDPQGVTSSNPKQFVSQRKGHKGAWGNFSDPVVWSVYSNSTSGTNGSNGTDGKDAKIDYMVPNGSRVDLIYDMTNKKFTMDIYVDFYIIHNEGDESITVGPSTSPKKYTDYKVKVKWDNGTEISDMSINMSSMTTSVKKSKTGVKWETSGTYYRKYMIIELYDKNNKKLDTDTYQVTLTPNAVQDVCQGKVDGSIPEIIQTVTGNFTNKFGEITNSISAIDQKCDSISSTVDNLNGNFSQIQQTAEQLSLTVTSEQDKLMKSGIDIQAGKIKISSANTEIEGDLSVVGANQGFSVWNSGMTKCAQLRTDMLGTLNNFSFNGYVPFNKEVTNKYKSSGSTFTITTTTINIGNIPSGAKVEVIGGNFNIWDYNTNKQMFIMMGSNRTISKFKITTQLTTSNTSNVITKQEGSWTNTPDVITRTVYEGYNAPDLTYTAKSSQTLYISYRIELEFKGEGLGAGYYNYSFNGTYIKQTEAMNYISPDGAIFSNSNVEYMWAGYGKLGSRPNDDWMFVVKNKRNGLCITPIDIMTFNPNVSGDDKSATNINNWYSLGTILQVLTVSSSINLANKTSGDGEYPAINRYGLVVFTNTSSIDLTLPLPSTCTGKTLWLRARGGGEVRIKCSSSVIMDDDTNATMNQLTMPGNKSCIMVSDGTYWYWFRTAHDWNGN